eukprot:jgi/Tetstr1/463002/TSEL_007941.t1
MLLRLDELDSRTSSIQQPPPQKPIHATPADGLEDDDEEDDPPPGFPAKSPGHAAFIDPRDWIDYLPRAHAESMPHVGLTNPGLWNPRNDEWDRYLTDEKHATRDEYRHLLCYGVFTAAAHAAHAALTDVVATLRAKNATARNTADANDLMDSAIIYSHDRDQWRRRPPQRPGRQKIEVSLHQAAKAQAAAQFKGSGNRGSGGGSGNIRIKEQERAEHADRATKERADKNKDKDKIKGKPQPVNPARKTTTIPRRPRSRTDGVPRRSESCHPSSSYMRHRVRRQWQQWQDIGAIDQVLRWIQEGVRIPFKHNRPPPNFYNGISMHDATLAQLTFLEGELARFVESGAWEFGTCRKWVSRLFLVPKPGVN